MRKSAKAFLLACVTVVFLCMASGCGGGDKIHAPFEASECKGKNIDAIVEQLESAGFTNIVTEPQKAATPSVADQVISVKFGSNTMWNSANSWKPDVEVVVKYYDYTDVFLDIEVSGEDGMPQFSIHTNLPDDTVLDVELSLTSFSDGYPEDYFEQRELVVSDGRAVTEVFTYNGEVLVGDYYFGVMMVPSEQPAQVLDEIGGSMGTELSGPLVEESGGANYIIASTEYHSPCEPPALAGDELKEAARSFDSSVMSAVSSVEQSYHSFLDCLSAGTMSDLEIYNAALDLEGVTEHCVLNILGGIEIGRLSGAKDVLDAARSYVYSMCSVADKTITYLDEQKTSALHDLQASMEYVSTSVVSLVVQRNEFLSSCGFSADEIADLSGAAS